MMLLCGREMQCGVQARDLPFGNRDFLCGGRRDAEAQRRKSKRSHHRERECARERCLSHPGLRFVYGVCARCNGYAGGSQARSLLNRGIRKVLLGHGNDSTLIAGPEKPLPAFNIQDATRFHAANLTKKGRAAWRGPPNVAVDALRGTSSGALTRRRSNGAAAPASPALRDCRAGGAPSAC